MARHGVKVKLIPNLLAVAYDDETEKKLCDIFCLERGVKMPKGMLYDYPLAKTLNIVI